MAKTIWKFPIQTTDLQAISMPRNAEMLCLQIQGNSPFIWALVDPNEPLTTRLIRIHGTGHPIDDDSWYGYIGTYQLGGGALVFHAFEVDHSLDENRQVAKRRQKVALPLAQLQSGEEIV